MIRNIELFIDGIFVTAKGWILDLLARFLPGWMIVLAPHGLLNGLLESLRIVDSPVKFMYSEKGIVIGLVLFIPFANRFGVFRMLVYGAMISSIALMPMALPWTIYGLSIGKAHYVMALLCMVLITIGEVVWSPKLYE